MRDGKGSKKEKMHENQKTAMQLIPLFKRNARLPFLRQTSIPIYSRVLHCLVNEIAYINE